MCPMLRFAPSEEASPRAKANLVRGVLTGRVRLERLTSDEVKEIADLCVHCHACRLECPARVDIPRLVREAMNRDTILCPEDAEGHVCIKNAGLKTIH